MTDKANAASSRDQQALARIVAAIGADSGTIHYLGGDGLLHLEAASESMPAGVLAIIQKIPVGKGMAGLAVERKKPVDACNIQSDTSGDVRPGAKATAMAGAIVVPIFRGEEVIGALGVANRAERTFTEVEIETLTQAGRELAQRRQRAGR